MRKVFALLLVGIMLLGLTACRKQDGAQADSTAQTQEKEEKQPEAEKELFPVTDVVIAADAVEGRKPSEKHQLPEQTTDMIRWAGETALLVQEEDVSFYALEGKESNPVMLCWAGNQGEFDWLYATPRAVAPQLWVFDMDGDGETEVVVNCYGGSGTGVSMEYLHVVEKDDGGLTAYSLPWKKVSREINEQLQAIEQDGKAYAALGDQRLDISKQVAPEKVKAVDICLGQSTSYAKTEDGFACSFGVVAEGPGIPSLSLYVGTVEGTVRYENGVFTLEELRLVKI